jgi:hypothetical protein
VVPNGKSTLAGLTDYDSVTDGYCTAQKTLFGDPDTQKAMGGLKGPLKSQGLYRVSISLYPTRPSPLLTTCSSQLWATPLIVAWYSSCLYGTTVPLTCSGSIATTRPPSQPPVLASAVVPARPPVASLR